MKLYWNLVLQCAGRGQSLPHAKVVLQESAQSECGGVLVAAALLRAVARLWEGDWDPVGCTRNGVVWKTPDYPAAAETGTIPVHRLKEPCSVFPHALCLA